MAAQDVAVAVRELGAALAAEVFSALQAHLPAPTGKCVGEPGSIEDFGDARTLALAARAVRMYAEMHPRPTQVTQA